MTQADTNRRHNEAVEQYGRRIECVKKYKLIEVHKKPKNFKVPPGFTVVESLEGENGEPARRRQRGDAPMSEGEAALAAIDREIQARQVRHLCEELREDFDDYTAKGRTRIARRVAERLELAKKWRAHMVALHAAEAAEDWDKIEPLRVEADRIVAEAKRLGRAED